MRSQLLDAHSNETAPSSPSTAPGKIATTAMLAPRRDAPATSGQDNVQRAAAAPVQLSADEARVAALSGVAQASSALPHGAAIQASFGHHDVSGVRAQVGGPAADASAALGAHAYATGDSVAFASSPDLHLAAHEAAHVVQQRGGVRLSGGIGQAGDSYEQHADAVADLVVRGESAESLLDTMAHRGSSGGAAVQGAMIQRTDAAAPAAAAPAASTPAPAAASASSKKRATTIQNIVVHQGPSKDSPPVTVQPNWVPPGTSFDVLGVSTSWLQVTHLGAPGYITGGSHYVKIEDAPAAPAAPATAPAAPAASPGLVDSFTSAVSSAVNSVVSLFTGGAEPTAEEKPKLDQEAAAPNPAAPAAKPAAPAAGDHAGTDAPAETVGGAAPAAPAPAAPAPSGDKQLSGEQWPGLASSKGWSSSHDLGTLAAGFAGPAKTFIDGLSASGAAVEITCTWRHENRAYLMHYAWTLESGEESVAKANSDCQGKGIAIEWDHGDPAQTQAAAAAMKKAFGLVAKPALGTLHKTGEAVDMKITGVPASLTVGGKTYQAEEKKSGKLDEDKVDHIGRELGVIWYGGGDYVHWSVNGH